MDPINILRDVLVTEESSVFCEWVGGVAGCIAVVLQDSMHTVDEDLFFRTWPF